MNCAECGTKLNPFGYLLAYIPDEERHRDFCISGCHEKYLQRYPKYSVKQMEKIFSHVKVDYDELEFDKFIEFFKVC